MDVEWGKGVLVSFTVTEIGGNRNLKQPRSGADTCAS